MAVFKVVHKSILSRPAESTLRQRAMDEADVGLDMKGMQGVNV
jgi:hypothetical protein